MAPRRNTTFAHSPSVSVYIRESVVNISLPAGTRLRGSSTAAPMTKNASVANV